MLAAFGEPRPKRAGDAIRQVTGYPSFGGLFSLNDLFLVLSKGVNIEVGEVVKQKAANAATGAMLCP